ncbi:MAG: Kae1-associated serine/threonine protein kinase [Nanoarchaeota archaeon]|nr:Kae1-associated serine/threonine protein kinase [Nanoarchaeota archaeon]
MKLIAQGAEAKLYRTDNKLVKDRIKKSYRIKEIDNRLRKFRTKREGKILRKLSSIGFASPGFIDSDEKEKLVMDFIRGKTLRDFLDEKNYSKLMKELGKKIAVLHNNNIIHGDLTTSNFIFNKEIFFIDFGLSFISHKIEDKAVDLHLLKQALESKHYKFWEKAYKIALEAYKKEEKQGKEILKRLELVETRGRYKRKK